MAITKKAPNSSKNTNGSKATVKSVISSANATTATGAAISKVVASSPTETATVSKTTASSITKSTVKPDASAIANRAYFIWKSEGCPEGRSMSHWLQAEKELTKQY